MDGRGREILPLRPDALPARAPPRRLRPNPTAWTAGAISLDQDSASPASESAGCCISGSGPIGYSRQSGSGEACEAGVPFAYVRLPFNPFSRHFRYRLFHSERGVRMRAVRLVGLAIAALAVVASAGTVYAQVDTGVMDGRVFEEQKAAMPGVTVTAKNVATGLTRTTVSGTTGTFHLEALRAGTYDVTAEIQGFATQVRKGIIVQIGSAVSFDFTMRVGNISETVTVSAESPLVQTTRSDVGQVISQTMVENMPLNGRKFQDLSLLVPGTRPANYYDPTKTEVGGISYGGLSGRSVNISVDGGDNNDGVVRGLLQQFSADAIQEYKVTTQRYSAEQGRSTGGLVNVITKSGTNEFRGSAFLFARNESLNAQTYFEKEANTGKQPFSQQQVGGTIGGPIKKDKAF